MATPAPVNQERLEAMSTAFTFNQIRNSVSILIEMEEEAYRKEGASEQDVINRIRQMGKKIGQDFSRYWTPTQKGIENMLISMYKAVFSSNVTIEEPADKQTVHHDYRDKKVYDVIDSKCPLCKDKRSTNISGCELVVGVIEGMFEAIAEREPDSDIPALKGDEVLESRTRGDDRCKHRYVLERPDHK
ncbi:MAG TPA: hypothetical protein VKM55_25650 [Candidatus Lokiarchaeia archaeon]|nr:hypothetical protein [Candidatus Lokiarchaeia archaeon]